MKKLHLYLSGDQECYTFWQYGILFALLPIILLFPLTFGVSLNLLKDRLITANSFLLATAVPYYACFLYLKKIIFGLQPQQEVPAKDKRCAEEIIEMEEMLFRADDGGIRWPVVQLYRNLIVVVLNIFILNRFYVTLSYFVVFVCFLLHDRQRMPFKHPYLNQLQVSSTKCM